MRTIITDTKLQDIADWNVERSLRVNALASTVHHLSAALGALPAGSSENTRHSIEHALGCARGNLRAVLNEPNPFV